MYESVIFDFDGTLVESAENYVNAFKKALLKYGFKKECEEYNIAELLGKNSWEIINIILSDKDEIIKRKVHNEFMKIVKSKEFRENIKLKKKTHEILRFLKSRKIKMFIISGSGKENLNYFLDNLKIKSYFTEIIDGESGFKPKPYPDTINYLIEKYDLNRNKIVFVGDGTLDYEMAKNAGIKFIGVRSEVIDEEHALKNKHGLIYCLDELKRYFLPKILAIVGMAGSGKSLVIEKLEKKLNIKRIYFGNITFEIMKKRGIKSEKVARELIRKELGMDAYARLNENKIVKSLNKNGIALIDGLYSWEEYLYLKDKFKDSAYIILISIVAPRNLRYYRLEHREVRGISRDQSYLRDISEVKNLNKGLPILMADYYILNDKSMEKIKNNVALLYHLFF